MQNYVYNPNFTGNVLIVRRTGCGKAYFTQKLTLNKFFGELKRAEWVWYINLDEERETEIESFFSSDVGFHYPKSIEQFEDLLEVFKARSGTAKRNNNDDDTSLFDNEFFNQSDSFGEKTTCDQLIVMDDVCGLAANQKNLQVL